MTALPQPARDWIHRFVSHRAQQYGYRLVPTSAATTPDQREKDGTLDPAPLPPPVVPAATNDTGLADQGLVASTANDQLPVTTIRDVDTIIALAVATAAEMTDDVADEASAAAYMSMAEIFERGLPDTKLFNYTPPPPRSVDLWTWIRSTVIIKTVIDIGANTGEYVEYLGNFFQPSAIYAFEPLTSCQPRLREVAEQFPQMQVFNLALDDHAGEETFWENEYGPSSSLLHVSDIHKEAFPHTRRESATTVQVARLDDVLDVATLSRGILIKIDVQGVEDRVIRGGEAVFSAADVVLIEMSFLALYDRQPIFDEINDLLRARGLRLVGVKDQSGDPTTGQPLFVHCFYRRDPSEDQRH